MNLFIIKKLGKFEYKVYLPFLYFSILFLLIISFIGLSENNWSLEPKYYSYCNDKSGCPNSYYNSISCLNSAYANTTLCTQPFLAYKESIGSKPSFITENCYTISVFIIGLFLFFNTFLFNKSFLAGIKLEEEK